MTQYLGVTQFVVGLLLAGYVIYSIEQAWSRAKARKQFEEAFAKYHQANIKLQKEEPRALHYIRLPHALKHHPVLSNLCTQHVFNVVNDLRIRLTEIKEPTIEIISMRFFKLAVPEGIIRVEAIRCGYRYAIIGAEDRYSGYVLRDDDLNRTLFGIIMKFQRERTTSSSEDVELHIPEVKADNKGD